MHSCKPLGMSYFLVDSQRIIVANSHVQQSISRLSQEVNLLHSQLSSLQEGWQGAAANSFQELFLRWKSSSQLLEESLAQIGQALALAAQQYSEVENANQRMFMQ